MNKKISLSSPFLKGNEKKYLNECIDTNWLTSNGKFVKLFENRVSKITNSKYVVSCINGTSALQLALKILGVKKNDEVIVPTLTFIASVNAIIYNNAKPLFLDVNENFTLSANKFENFIKNYTIMDGYYCINKKTKRRIFAIIIVHTWGNAADIIKIHKICKLKNIKIVEDAAESFGTYYNSGKFKNYHTGTIGDIGCISFNGNKIFTTGGGGALLLKNKNFEKKARYLINQAKDNNITYQHNEVGYNFSLSNLHAAIGLAQLENFEKILLKKKKIRKWYEKLLGKDNLYSLPKFAHNNCWLNILKLQERHSKIKLLNKVNYLMSKNIETRPVWQLNHTQKMFKNYFTYEIDTATKLYEHSLCLPSSTNLTFNDIKYIVKNL